MMKVTSPLLILPSKKQHLIGTSEVDADVLNNLKCREINVHLWEGLSTFGQD